ncbi:MAG TPA: gamma-glutamyl-gamma-aminobutyrate hydrolase family protein, partial [Candidatus Angelobacter sp.]|nr:gamma-glutamyl-gamma-aminobutyrate hydrolase family protein [Candidatus Angelobacter sp.]
LLLQDAYSQRKPILGICYGLQALNVWRSGTLEQHIESPVQHTGNSADVAHHALVTSGSLLGSLTHENSNSIPVNSSHHQAAEKLGDGLRVAAQCPQDQVIEAIEGVDPEHPVLAVQWHPERTSETDATSRKLFEWLVRSARDWQSDRK